MIKSVFGHGNRENGMDACVSEAVKDFENPKLIFFFSDEKNFPEYAKRIHKRFPDAISIGCSTYRTSSVFGLTKEELVVAAIEDGIACSANVIEHADKFALIYADNVRDCLESMESTENSVCIEFTAPYKRAEEYTLMVLNSVLLRHDIPVIGGTAAHIDADNGEIDDAYVALNGEVYDDGSVFVLVQNLNGAVSFYRENIYEPLTGNKLLVTKANSVSRTIMSFEGEKALDVYARELDTPVSELTDHFFHYPMGNFDGDSVYITAIHGTTPNHSMKFLARVHEGTEMLVMKEGDYRRITHDTIEKIKKEIPKSSFVFMFHCMARTILFESQNYTEEYQELLARNFSNFIGFSCLGEQYQTKNVNHTLTMVVFEDGGD